MIGWNGEINVLQRAPGVVDEKLMRSPLLRQAWADHAIDRYRVTPGLRVGRFHNSPVLGVAIRTEGASRLRRLGVAVSIQPSEAIPAAHIRFNQRPSVDLPFVAGRLHARCFVGRYADPLLDAIGPSGFHQIADFLSDGLDLVLSRALTIDRAALLGEKRRPAIEPGRCAVHGVNDLLSQIAGRNDPHRERQDVPRHQPSQMAVNRFWFGARIREDRAIRHWRKLTMSRHQRHRRALHASSERDNPKH